MNTDAFDLYTDPKAIPTYAKRRGALQDYKVTQVSGDRTGTAFAGQPLEFEWAINSNEGFNPSEAYLRMRVQISYASTGTKPLSILDQVAPSMGLCSCLFQNYRVELNGTQISKVDTYSPQIDALVTRMEKSKGWLDTVGAATNFYQSSFQERVNSISWDGYDFDRGITKSTISARADLGFDAVDATNGQSIAYTTATRTVTFAVTGTGNALPVPLPFTAGDIVYQGAVRLGVVATVSTSTLVLAPAGAYGSDVAAEDNVEIYRERIISSTNARRSAKIELTWRPPLGFFRQNKVLPCGKYRLIMNTEPSATLYTRALEALASKTLNTNVYINVIKTDFYIKKMQITRKPNFTYYMALNEVHCQTGSLSSGTGENNFNVKNSTYAVTVAFQDNRVETNIIYSPTIFKISGSTAIEQSLTKLRIDYAGQHKSIPDADPEYTAGTSTTLGIDYRTKRYVDSLYYANAVEDTGGCETIEEWDNRGPYFHFDWIKDGSNTSSDLVVNYTFTTDPSTYGRLLLFSHYRNIVKVVIEENKVKEVYVEEA